MTYEQWTMRHPHAAAELGLVLTSLPWPENVVTGSEGKAQQNVRMIIARGGGMGWRNNVGATPSKCPDCGTPRIPIRYGLANDSAKLNERVKSSDIIAAIPRLITPAMVGTTIAQFGSVEVKPPGWKHTGKGREAGQAVWLALIKRLGGYATFSTGDLIL